MNDTHILPQDKSIYQGKSEYQTPSSLIVKVSLLLHFPHSSPTLDQEDKRTI